MDSLANRIGERGERRSLLCEEFPPAGFMREARTNWVISIDPSRIVPAVDQVARYFGGTRYRPDPNVQERIKEAIDTARRLIEPRSAVASYRIVAFSADGALELESDGRLQLPCFDEPYRPQFLAVAVATLGPGLEAYCRELADAKQVYESTLIDAVGTAMLDLLATGLRKLLAHHGKRVEIHPGPRFAPGIEGYPLEHQRVLFDLVDENSAGVRLNEAFVMDPVKSVSFFQLYLSEPYEGLPTLKCTTCKLAKCLYRSLE